MRKEGGCEVFSFSLWQGPCHIPFNDASIPTIAFLSSFGLWNIWGREHADYRGLCTGLQARLSLGRVLSNILKFRKGTLVKLGELLVDRKWVRNYLTSPNFSEFPNTTQPTSQSTCCYRVLRTYFILTGVAIWRRFLCSESPTISTADCGIPSAA